MSTCFVYVYRDGSNYKQWGEIVFAGEFSPDLSERLITALDSSEFFIADQVRIPELFFKGGDLYADDHCWHEFSEIVDTADLATDPYARTFEQFVCEVEVASTNGWRVFDPLERQLATRSGDSSMLG